MNNQTQRTVERDYSLLRILGLFLVIVGHSIYTTNISLYGGIDYSGFYQNTTATYIWTQVIIEMIYAFHMPLFVFISGALYARSRSFSKYAKYGELIFAKFERLIVPYLVVATLFMVPIKLLTHYYPTGSSLMKIYGFGILLSLDSGHLWYVFMLFMMFVIVRICENRLRNIHPGLLVGTLILLHLSSWNFTTNIFQISNVFKYLVYFYLGFLFQQHKSLITSLLMKKKAILCLISLVYFIVLNLYIRDPAIVPLMRYSLLFVDSILGLIWIYSLVLIIAGRISNQSRIENFLNENSFGIYLLHDPFNYVILAILVRFKAFNQIANSDVYTIILMMTRVAVPVLLSLLVLVMYQKAWRVLLLIKERFKQTKKHSLWFGTQ